MAWLLVVLGVWACLELQAQGTQGAFGGRLAALFSPIEPVRREPVLPRSPITHQVRDRVSGIMADYERDRERQAGGR
jgi:hypothetical protein